MATTTDGDTTGETSTNYRETIVNDHTVELWGQQRDLEARRVAARLPRALDGVRAVESGYADPYADANIWIHSLEGGEEIRSYDLDELGLEVVHLSLHTNGNVCIGVDLETEGSP
jgi:glyoxylase-like metal-dependent hydrolase (beta-lactamase superfamily II)